ncbi:MAG: nicotinamide mononucleotide transporter family protein [Saprospiraceae bacterium]|nr:nicotinamide mononucleotide transporter family protein [Saprospiraceae bacterium]
MQTRIPVLRSLVLSPYLDLFGAGLVLFICIWRNFHGTIYFEGQVVFGVLLRDLPGLVKEGAYPLGIFSTIGAVLSLLSTRLIGKQNNLGNVLGIFTTVNSGANDFLFGNGSAAITYPFTFLIMSYVARRWQQGEVIRKIDARYYVIVCVGLLLGTTLVFLGAHWFGGRQDIGFLAVVSLTFGLSLGANFSSAFKYEETWLSWTIYNIVQLVKNVMIANLANVAKYVFYLFNAAVTLGDWKFNGDRDQSGMTVATSS